MDCQKKATVKGLLKDRGGAAFVPHPLRERYVKAAFCIRAGV